jgi:ubiquinone/menaquinone biosynthesis C-methylase UbiE
MKGHKWFAARYDSMLSYMEKKFLADVRRDLLAGITGEVLEIGAGTGLNFSHYRNGARITATEPDPFMFERAQRRVASTPADITLQQAAAEDLPFSEGTFDFVVDTLVLCSVQDPARALSEVKRVLKPGGEFRLYEHVRYEDRIGAFVQDAITPVWRWLGAGCNPNRDTGRAVRDAGFDVVSEEREMPPVPRFIPSRPHIRMVVRRPL